MALDSRYIQAFTIEDVLLDKDTGAPLAGGLVYFYEDDQRTVLKPVYELTGTSPNYTYTQLPNPVVLSAIGTFEDSMANPKIPYFFPYDDEGNIQRYYIYVTDADGVFQFAREAQPYVFTTTLPPDQIINGENLLANPQFVEVSFNSLQPHIYTFSGASNESVEVAPDWNLIVSGSGSITVERIALTETDTPSNPPYVLDIECSGVSVIILRQRFTQSPRLLANAFISGYFIAASEDNLPHTLQMQYNPSAGTLTDNIIIDEIITSDGSYNRLQGNLEITGVINPNPATTGYVDIDIVIPQGSHLRLSSFQVVGANTAVNLAFDQQPAARQIDHLFHFYEDAAVHSPKKSMVPWWKFSLNPNQFSVVSAPITSQCSYIIDQTIVFQPAASQVQYSSGSGIDNGSFFMQAQAGATDARFALITYLAPQSCQGAWGNWLSSRVRAELGTGHGSVIRFKMRLIWRATLPAVIGATEPIASWALGSDPTFSAGWNAIVPLNDPEYTFNLNPTGTMGADTFSYYDFDEMQLPIPTAAATNMFALVLYVMDPLNSTTGSMDFIYFNEITLTPGQFAIDSDQFAYSEVLAACQFYYQKSYSFDVFPGTVTRNNEWYAIQDASGVGAILFELRPFMTRWLEKCISPEVHFYSPVSGTIDNVYFIARVGVAIPLGAEADAPISNWAEDGTEFKTGVVMVNTSADILTAAAGAVTNGYLIYHWTADSRLGAF